MIKIYKPKFWDKKIGLFSILLFPIALAYIIIIFLKKKITKEKKFKTPIICIGNIYIGGTGKTPTSIYFGNEIFRSGKNPFIIRRYHQSHIDEYNLIRKKFKNLIVNKDRINGLREAEKSNSDIIILDDGFQDYRIKKDLNILCFNSNQLIGNGLVIPSGPLRENLSALKNAHIIIINGNKDLNFERKILNINSKLDIYYSSYVPTNLDQFKNNKLFAIAGIGNPQNFFQLLEKNNLNIHKKLIFPDHYRISEKEIKNIIYEASNENCQIIMTEKDYFKINTFKIEKINYLKVSLEIKEKEKILKKIQSIYD